MENQAHLKADRMYNCDIIHFKYGIKQDFHGIKLRARSSLEGAGRKQAG